MGPVDNTIRAVGEVGSEAHRMRAALDEAHLPTLLVATTGATRSFYFGGTSLLIVVGVALDTMKQLEAQLMMRNYEGFLK